MELPDYVDTEHMSDLVSLPALDDDSAIPLQLHGLEAEIFRDPLMMSAAGYSDDAGNRLACRHPEGQQVSAMHTQPSDASFDSICSCSFAPDGLPASAASIGVTSVAASETAWPALQPAILPAAIDIALAAQPAILQQLSNQLLPPVNTTQSQAAASMSDTAQQQQQQPGAVAAAASNQSLCTSCCQLKAEGDRLHRQVQDQLQHQAPAAGLLTQGIAAFLAQVTVRCERCSSSDGNSSSRTPCLAQLQLPTNASQCWQMTLVKARLAEKGRQRAGAGTSAARQFNFHANAPCMLNSSLQQLLQPGSSDGAPASTAAAAAAAIYFSIRSKDRHIVAHALVRPAEQGGETQADEHLWSRRLITCSKKGKWAGHVFDSFKFIFVSIGAPEVPAAGPNKRRKTALGAAAAE